MLCAMCFFSCSLFGKILLFHLGLLLFKPNNNPINTEQYIEPLEQITTPNTHHLITTLTILSFKDFYFEEELL